MTFVTAHDGFTLRDLVSYNDKHNEANDEDHRDGESNNRSWNCGAQGPTDDAKVNRLRARQARNLPATLFLSQGVPMLVGGDEIGRTQRGTNNAYSQDNEISWFDWENVDQGLLDFVRRLIRLRKEHPVFHRRRWFQGQQIHGSKIEDIAWFDPCAKEMSEEEWQAGFANSLGIFLNGQPIASRRPRGERVMDDTFFVLCNAHYEPVTFHLPQERWGKRWKMVLDTNEERDAADDPPLQSGSEVRLEARSPVVLRREV